MKTMKQSTNRSYEWKLESCKMRIPLLVGLLALATGLFGQNAIPAGTILPLQLNSSLNSRKSKPGQMVTARLMQDVPLPSGGKIRAGSKAVGRVLDVVEAGNGSGAKISLRFDTLEVSKRMIPMTTNLRALASMMEVEDAQLPKTGPDRGTPQEAWTTTQIGDDVVYRGGGPVANGLRVVGTPTFNGVLVRVASQRGAKCRGDLSGNDQPQALWLFSADACGTYGFTDLTIAHAGRNAPLGQITLVSEKSNFDVRSGSGLLLRVK
ncbi:MAG: hypothetical protein WCA13_12965 [Terriglobales bacterium]